MSFRAYPKHFYHQNKGGDYDIVNPLNEGLLGTISKKDYDAIKEITPDGKSYEEAAVEGREKKLKIVRKFAPKEKISNPSAEGLSKGEGHEL